MCQDDRKRGLMGCKVAIAVLPPSSPLFQRRRVSIHEGSLYWEVLEHEGVDCGLAQKVLALPFAISVTLGRLPSLFLFSLSVCFILDSSIAKSSSSLIFSSAVCLWQFYVATSSCREFWGAQSWFSTQTTICPAKIWHFSC